MNTIKFRKIFSVANFQFLLLSIFLFSVFLAGVCSAKIVDTDKDGLNDDLEVKIGTDPTVADSDNDGYKDGQEVFNGFNPFVGGRDRQVKRSAIVDKNTQKLDYFFNGIKIGSMPVSTGVLGWDTPNGDFKILRKLPVHRYVGEGYDLPNTKWNLEFKRGFYLHGAYWHNQFGIRPMSHGCVNIAYKEVEKLYRFLDLGDAVKIVGKTPIKSLKK